MVRKVDVSMLELVDISKSYGVENVLSGVNLRIAEGEIVAIAGENGAGKSTLMCAIYGLTPINSGAMLWHNKEVRLRGPNDARKLGIGMVMQHFSLFESMTVLENAYLYLSVTETLSMADVRQRAQDVSKKFALSLPLNRRVSELSVGDKQRLEIFKCLLQEDLSLLILDEPTALLSDQEAQALIALLTQLARSGCSVLYVSHKLKELMVIADRVAVLNKGQLRDTLHRDAFDEARLLKSMLGVDASDVLQRSPAPHPTNEKNTKADLSATLHGVCTAGRCPLRNLDLRIEAGEILGIAGISGNGQEELVDAISGELPILRGELTFSGDVLTQWSLTQRYKKGVVGMVADRNHRASANDYDLVQNTYLKYRIKHHKQRICWETLREHTRRIIAEFKVAGATVHTKMHDLSGGNRQKFIVGRELLMGPKLLICHQPTWGVDLKSAAYIHSKLKALTRQGAMVIIISEDLDELYAHCDSLAVLYEGRLSPKRPVGDFSRMALGKWLSGAAFSEGDTDKSAPEKKRGAL